MTMKMLFIIFAIFSLQSWAQDPISYFNNFDAKIYSLKNKGVKDFVVDIESSKLTKQINDQMIFGKVNEVIFRTYWTANPERVAIEVIGLPEGFKEIKEELKLSIFSILDNLIPIPIAQRFTGYKFHSGAGPKEFIGDDSSGIAAVQSYIIRFDNQDKMLEIEGKKPVGTLKMTPKYERDAFADGKWVLKSLVTSSFENGQTVIIRKDLSYGTSQGIGVLGKVKVTTEQKSTEANSKPLILEESVEFSNYKINNGDALKYFLGESSKNGP
jgi:hypothetical protein